MIRSFIAISALALATSALATNEIDNAIAQAEKTVVARPNDSHAYYDLGMAYIRKAEKGGMMTGLTVAQKARDAFLRASELDPNALNPRLRLIDFYVYAPGLIGGGEQKAFEQATEIGKRDALDGHRARARIYALQKKPELAVKELSDAVRAMPKSARAHYFLANALLTEKDWKGALAEYDATLALDPAYMPAHFRMGQHAAQSESNYARGEESLRKYLTHKPTEEEPSLARAWYWLGVLQEKQGRKAQARESYATSQKLAPDAKDVGEALKRVS